MKRTPQRNSTTSSNSASALEWQLLDDDREWESRSWEQINQAGDAATPPNATRTLPLWLRWGLAAMIVVLAGAGIWLWRAAQSGLEMTRGELHTAAELELWAAKEGESNLAAKLIEPAMAPIWQQEYANDSLRLQENWQILDPSIPLKTRLSLKTKTELVALEGDRAAARVQLLASGGSPLYRQTRFYRHTSGGWLRTAPAEGLWGAPQQLETTFFVFYFRRQDAEVIAEAAPQINTLYDTMRHNFGLANAPNAQKLVVDVNVMLAPGNVVERPSLDVPFRVASPALYLAPAKWSDAQLLVQALALPLIDHVLTEAINHYGVDWRWQPLLRGLRLWQFWDLDLPLSTWHSPIVNWLYVDGDGSQGSEPAVLPDHYARLCAEHTLWLKSPAQLYLPLLCSAEDRTGGYARGWGSLKMPLRLHQIAAALPDRMNASTIRRSSNPADAVALATLVEYAVVSYGREQLPALVAALSAHERWDTLLPALFDVMPDDFETGWRAYLAEHYGSNLLSRER